MFRIDPEFKKLIPALSTEEYMQLETNINEDGCRDPLTVWQEENLLLDGHNRFEICKQYGLEYELFFVSLPDRQSAINWIINNQLGRRNVTPEQASYLRGKRYNMEKESRGGDRGNQYTVAKDHFDTLPESTATRLADEFKVSEPTIKRDGKFAAAVDTLADTIGDEARTAVLSGNSKVTKQDVTDAAEWYKSNPGERPTIEREAEELAGDDSAYDWTEDEKSETPILVAKTEKEILDAANRIRREKKEAKRQ